MKSRETKEVVVGALMIVLLVAAIFLSIGGGNFKARASGTNEYSLTATFNRVDGLVVGDAVQLGGIRVGSVVGERLDNHYRAVLTLRLRKGIELPADSSAAIHTDGLFGAKHIVLEPGGDETILKDGSEITYTQDAVIVSELLELIISQGKAKRAQAAKPD